MDYKSKLEEITYLNIFELGDIKNDFGRKYKNISIKNIYQKDKQYLKWVKNNTNEIIIKDNISFEMEYSRLAMILYYDMMDFIKNQGK